MLVKNDNVKKYAKWIMWASTALFYFYVFSLRVSVGTIVPDLMHSFHASAETIGNISAYYYYAFALAQIPAGMLLDKFELRSLLTLAIIVTTLGTLSFGISENVYMAELSRIIIGVGASFAFTGCLKLISSQFSKQLISFVTGLTVLVGASGAMVGEGPFAFGVNLFGWRYVEFLFVLFGVILAVTLYIVLPKHFKNKKQQAIKKSYWATIYKVFSNRQNWMLTLYCIAITAPASLFVALWGESFFVVSYHLSAMQAGDITSMGLLGLAIGSPLCCLFSNKIRSRRLTMLLCAIVLLLITYFLIYKIIFPVWGLYCLVLLFGFFSSGLSISFVCVQESNSDVVKGTAISLVNAIALFSGGLAQSLAGFILNHENNALHSVLAYQHSFVIMPCCYVAAIVILFFIKETVGV